MSTTLRLPRTARVRESGELPDVLKAELEAQPPDRLPLQQALARGSHALGAGFSVTVLHVTVQHDLVRARVGVFFEGLVAGCGCADDPTPVQPHPEYCELLLEVDRGTGWARVELDEREGSE